MPAPATLEATTDFSRAVKGGGSKHRHRRVELDRQRCHDKLTNGLANEALLLVTRGVNGSGTVPPDANQKVVKSGPL